MAWVLHVDLDQFIAAVEVLRRPELRGRPVVVGGDGDPTKRGVVSTASYEARAFGVHSGVPLRTAARRCPDAIFLAVDREAYEAASARVMAVLRSFDAVVEVLGWDEAFLGLPDDSPPPEAVAEQIRARVRDGTELECSIGIGHNRLQAKLATGFGKPGGVFRITEENWFSLLGERPPDALWGIGSRTAKRLAAAGITTVASLAAADPSELAVQFGPSTGPWLSSLGRGEASSRVSDEAWVARSRSRETTFQTNVEDWEAVREAVLQMARVFAAEDRSRPVARVIVKIRFAPFFTQTRGRAVSPASSEPDVIGQAAVNAVDAFTDRRAVRLVGVRLEYSP